jgi:tetratricopeptide (TPR) repeat protein
MTSSNLSIVTPVLNGMPFIRECVESVSSQPVSIEHIVCDGGSTDGTLEYLRILSDVRLIEGPDKGQGDALAKGLTATSGSVMGWLNADDRLLPGAASRIMDSLYRHPAAIAVAADGRQINATGAMTGGITGMATDRHAILFRDTLLQPSTWFRRDAYEAAGGLDPSLSYCMDSDLWRRLLAVGPIVRIQEIWSDYRLHPGSKTFCAPSRFIADWRRVLETHVGPATAQAYDCERCGGEWVVAAMIEDAGLREKLAAESDAATAAWIRGLLDLRVGRRDEARDAFRAAAMGGTPAVRLQALRELMTIASIEHDAAGAETIAHEVERALDGSAHVDHPGREGVWARYALASILESAGRLDEAETAFKAVIGVEPTDVMRFTAGSWFHLGRIRAAFGRREDARSAYLACLAIVPGHSAATVGVSELKIA